MKIMDLLKLCHYEDVEKKIVLYYGDKELDECRKLYQSLKNMTIKKPLIKDLYIGITVRKQNEDGTDTAVDVYNENDPDIYFDVNGFEPDDEMLHSIAALSYEEFLQYGIGEETLLKFSYESILAHSLWEITSYGFEDNIMTIIGDKSSFAIEYSLFPIEKEDEILWQQLQGTMAVYVNGQNISRYVSNGEESNFIGVIFYIVDWLCENFSDIIGYDPYPMPVEGENLLELINSANKFETDDEIEEYLWYSSERNWIFRHSWRAVSETVISNTFFRRTGDMIEVSWDNSFWREKNVEFISLVGTQLIELETFRVVVLDFLFDLLNSININYKEGAHIVKGWVSNLQLFMNDMKLAKEILEKCENILK